MSQQPQRKTIVVGNSHKWQTTTEMFSVPEFAPINSTTLTNETRVPQTQPHSQPQFKKFTQKKAMTQHVTNLKDLNLELLTKVQIVQPVQQMRGSRIKKSQREADAFNGQQSRLQSQVQSIIHASNAPFNKKPAFRE